jgi:anti-sigma B factor antagonist
MAHEAAASPLTLEVDRTAEAAIVRCNGRLVTGMHTSLYSKVSELIPHSKRIVLDLSGLTFMDSTGLGTLVRLYVVARSAGCSLELLNLGARIRELFRIANLLSVFTVIGENNIRHL